MFTPQEDRPHGEPYREPEEPWLNFFQVLALGMLLGAAAWSALLGGMLYWCGMYNHVAFGVSKLCLAGALMLGICFYLMHMVDKASRRVNKWPGVY